MAYVDPDVAKVEDAADSRRPMRQAQGEAVVGYAELLPTKEMRYPRLSLRVNNLAVFLVFCISLAVNSSKLLKKAAK
ncbi:MAG: hypothetical protein JW883_02515, partial [Deltaproteobacteria bacterium]|nr:hypothetical protein [Deltaproteobacteria bacterium]